MAKVADTRYDIRLMRADPFKRAVGTLALLVAGAVATGACAVSSATATDRLATGPGAVTTVTTLQPTGRTAPPPATVTDSGNTRDTGDKRSSLAPSSTTSSSTTTTAKPLPMDDKQLTVGEQGPEIALL